MENKLIKTYKEKRVELDNAEEEMDLPVTCNDLTWEEVFEQRYDEQLSTS